MRFDHSPVSTACALCLFAPLLRTGSSLTGTPGHLMPGFFFTGFPNIPVTYSDRPFETQRTSRGKPRLLSAHDCQIYLAQPCNGYRTLSCVADSSRLHPASNLPALYLHRYGAYLYVNPRFCLRLPSGAPCGNTLAFDYPSAPSAWIWTLQNICVINISASPISTRTSPAHNLLINRIWQKARQTGYQHR